MSAAQVATSAEALVGTPFRLHGRDPATGLDCIGVVAAALARGHRPVSAPTGYSLRNRSIVSQLAFAERAGLVEAQGQIEPGDIVLVRPGPAQHHLLVAVADGSFVHAHAGLRRVVSTPAPLAWPTVRHWRVAP
ncbi:NlpC/P60 family protein [Tsuneonella mangrovi]|uniref:NlpC/P60 family protein n=1 Tax=Tsuneonella mangrovi TaxID=1982042 RepID=UPI000BA2B87B|nr:NlpC/P60 family protein [Tsuneonella mangrovi]